MIIRRNNANAFIPLRRPPTPVIAVVPAQAATVETVLVGTGAEAFLQGVLPVLAVFRCRRYIATRL